MISKLVSQETSTKTPFCLGAQLQERQKKLQHLKELLPISHHEKATGDSQ